MTELEILAAVKNNGGYIEFTQLLNLNASDVDRDFLADKALIRNLITAKVLRGELKAYANISLTESGHLRLRELQQSAQIDQERHEESAKKDANDKTEKKKERAFQVRLTFYGALFGAIFSNLDRIATACIYLWDLLISLF